MSKISIRQAGADDAERLDMALRRLAKAIGDPYGATAEMLRTAGYGAAPAFRALLAESDGETVGAALYSPVFSTVRAGAGVYVSDLWVSETERGGGLGRRLLQAATEDAARIWKAKFLKLAVHDHNDAARAFYAHLGFEAAGGESILTLDETGLAMLAKGGGTR